MAGLSENFVARTHYLCAALPAVLPPFIQMNAHTFHTRQTSVTPRIFTLFLVCVLWGGRCVTQDVHFSQPKNVPLALNPAQAGFYDGADYRSGFQHRLQHTPSGSAYHTYMLWADMVSRSQTYDRGWMGFGVYGLYDNTVLRAISKYQFSLVGSYHHILSPKTMLSVGLQANYIHRILDYSQLVFGDQFNGLTFDRSVPTQDVLFQPSLQYLSVYPSAQLTHSLNTSTQITVGAGIENVNMPKTLFFTVGNKISNTDPNRQVTVPLRYNANIEISRWVSHDIAVHVWSYMVYFQRAYQGLSGVYLDHTISGNRDLRLRSGLGYRVNSSVIGFLGLQNRVFRLGMSYDFSFAKNRFSLDIYPAFETSLSVNGNFIRIDKVGQKRRRRIECFGF